MFAAGAACRLAFRDGLGETGASEALVAGSLLNFEAQLGEHFAPTWTAGWWLYHGQLLAAFAALLWVILAEYIHSETRVAPAPASAPLGDASRLTESGYEGVVRSFVSTVEARRLHGRRVAILCVFIGMELRLPADRLQAIARGALLRDVGKISVPDAILAKPEQLTPEEYDVIRQHRHTVRRCSARSSRAASSGRSSVTTTSGSTAPATPTSSQPTPFRSRPASSPSRTCTTRCAPIAPSVERGRQTSRAS